ncbi:MAG: hypothetical protein Q8S21_03955 [Candidatus Paracaedibacteraceae bacterium]|nr:hypothetical protein [Candidatus Paracaedibacteraceae bacterium]
MIKLLLLTTFIIFNCHATDLNEFLNKEGVNNTPALTDQLGEANESFIDNDKLIETTAEILSLFVSHPEKQGSDDESYGSIKEESVEEADATDNRSTTQNSTAVSAAETTTFATTVESGCCVFWWPNFSHKKP